MAKPTLYYFWADWCQPCRGQTPIMEELAATDSRFQVVKINVDEPLPVLENMPKLSAVPTIMLAQGNEVVWAKAGAIPKFFLLQELERYL